MMRRSATKLAIGALAAGVALIGSAASKPDAARGARFVRAKVYGLPHPPLRGGFGRPTAGDAQFPYAGDGQFPYADALKKARVTWDETTLDRWLTDPESLVPDNDMSFRLENAMEHADIGFSDK